MILRVKEKVSGSMEARLLICYRIAARTVAWIGIVGILILSVVPANERPTLAEGWFGEWAGHIIDHSAAFALVAAAFAIGYRFSLIWLLFLAFCFAAAIELLQVPVPTRHARMSDFVIDFVASCVAIAMVLIGERLNAAHAQMP